ncbi:hypothetical protein Tco_0541481 [Tanacetum coccineum]
MNTTQAQQKALDDALVTPVDHLEFRKCNMRLKTYIKPKEATFQVVMDALALTPFYQAFLITTEVPAIYMQEFWATIFVHKEFATVINKCLSCKETGMDKIHLSRAQILWGMFYKKNIDYVYLLWEDLLFQIENKEAKKTNKMSYPRFTKIIIDYFMSKDQHEDTQVYGTILPKELTNQSMLESKAYKTYYAFASGEKTPKPKLKTKAKVAKSDKKKQPAKMPKAKGLDVLSKVALTKAEQLKLTAKRSKTQFHSSHASGLGDRVDNQSKVPDEQHLKTTGADEGTDAIPWVLDVPKYKSKNKSDGNDDDGNQEGDDTNDNDEETDSDSIELDRIKIPVLKQSSTKTMKKKKKKKILMMKKRWMKKKMMRSLRSCMMM